MKTRTRIAPVIAALIAVPAGVGLVAVGGPAMAAGHSTARHGNSIGMSPNTTNVRPMVISSNEKTAFNYFVKKGLSKTQAAGVVGNLVVESGMDPTIKQIGGGPGRGIAQWSVGGRWDHDSKDNVKWYVSQHGGSMTSLTKQLDFTWYELKTFSRYGYSSLKSSTSISGATVAFEKKFEGCGTCNQSNRVAAATSAYNKYAGGGGSNPYQPTKACGSGYAVIDKHGLGSSGTVYLLYSGVKKANCVVTMKGTKLGTKSAVSASLQVKGGSTTTDSGNYTYYAGPLRKTAANKCVKWGGTAGSTSWTSAYSHCG